MRFTTFAATLLASAGLAACGGGGSGGPIVVPSPAPSPTPTPSPAPTPAVTRFQLEAGGPLIGELRFYRTALPEVVGGDFASVVTNRNGVFWSTISDPITPGRGATPFIDDGANALGGVAVDRGSAQVLSLFAPRGSTVLSPITSLMTWSNQTTVKRALGLSDGPFRLADPSRDLTRFSVHRDDVASDPAAVDRRRLRAANIRTIAYLHAFKYYSIGPGLPSWIAPRFDFAPDMLAAVLNGNAAIRLDTVDGIEAALRDHPLRDGNLVAYRGDVIVAAAHLIALYAQVIGVEIANDADAARLMLGIQGFLQPTLADLMEGNSQTAAQRVAGLTEADVRAAIAPFGDHLPASANLLLPAPDFLRMAAGERALIPLYRGTPEPALTLAGNDLVQFLTYPGLPIGRQRLTIAKLILPARFSNVVSVTEGPGQTVDIQMASNFAGIAWFDYTVRAPGGEEATARAYLIGR